MALRGPSAGASRARVGFLAAADSNAAALIVADRGLDAEAIACALHDRSRPGLPFIAIDCAAPEDEVDGWIFGRVSRRDAHAELVTVGAESAFLRARAGTIYLKQILELPAATQRRLARVLRDSEVVAAGRRVRVKARIVSDAPASVTSDVRDGQLRSDLFRRLSQLRVEVPALRERPDDMRDVAEAIAAQLRGGAPTVFTRAALTVLAAPAWPGNLDELRLVLDRVLRAESRDAVRQEDVLAHLPLDGAFARMAPAISLREARRQFEREYIASVLERHRWRMSDAARTLGIERANLYRKTRQLGILRRSSAARVAS